MQHTQPNTSSLVLMASNPCHDHASPSDRPHASAFHSQQFLLLNAGVGAQPFRVVHGVELTLFIIHVAHQLQATRLLPVLEQIEAAKIYINSIHPRCVASNVVNKKAVMTQMPTFVSSIVGFAVKTNLRWFGVSPETGALTPLYVVTSRDIESNA
ncbi:hypothetical protein LEN26_008537 [Aphanomyces euteiches]|nr:hypothetical protein AeMF1_014006 [Aphanomyces euteiches]KAH9130421.1 hypothetical protein LEN26_008537 [Aphanomyces euteiches]